MEQSKVDIRIRTRIDRNGISLDGNEDEGNREECCGIEDRGVGSGIVAQSS